MLNSYQREQLESLFRKAVHLQVNPAGGPAFCECGCGRIGTMAHHVVYRSQEPALRLLYEPRFAVLLAQPCHTLAHSRPSALFVGQLATIMARTNPKRGHCLARYAESHDRLRAREVDWRWMRGYLKRCIITMSSRWHTMYCQDVMA
jgi:hypothetical protein